MHTLQGHVASLTHYGVTVLLLTFTRTEFGFAYPFSAERAKELPVGRPVVRPFGGLLDRDALRAVLCCRVCEELGSG